MNILSHNLNYQIYIDSGGLKLEKATAVATVTRGGIVISFL